MSRPGVSPSSSPRLPSPPPFTEVQIAPKSPITSDGMCGGSDGILGMQHGQDEASARRIRPGTRAADMASGPPLIPLSKLDSPFQLQEHLKASYHHYTQPPGSDTILPINADIARALAIPPASVERSLWLYELCRFLTMKANNLVIAFFAEDPPCSAQTCPEMRASEWQYLCAVHDPPKPCCAIDYCCHTLDWATNVLTSPKLFPSRLTLGTDATGGPQASMRHLTNVFRRVYRIFAHAWFQHRDVFWQVEGHDGLYVFFKTVCDVYNLIPEDNYTIPPEAEGEEPSTTNADNGQNQGINRRLTILRKDDPAPVTPPNTLDEAGAGLAAATTRRHRHTPSTGVGVTTIAEAAEDEDINKNPPEPKRLSKGPEIQDIEKEHEKTEEKQEEEPVSASPSEVKTVSPETRLAEDSRTSTEEESEAVTEEKPTAPSTIEEKTDSASKKHIEEAPGSPGPSEATEVKLEHESADQSTTAPPPDESTKVFDTNSEDQPPHVTDSQLEVDGEEEQTAISAHSTLVSKSDEPQIESAKEDAGQTLEAKANEEDMQE